MKKLRAIPAVLGLGFSAIPALGRRFFWLLAAASVCPIPGFAADAGTASAASFVITDPIQVYSLSTEQRTHSYPLHFEGRVSYYDPGFKIFWFEQNNFGNYVQLADPPPDLRTGQRVVIDGKITPSKGLSAEEVTVRVVEEDAPVTPLVTKDRINDFDAFHGRIATVEGYVDSQQYIDRQHIRLILIVENRQVICWVRPADPEHVPTWQGCFVRATGLYSRKFDPARTSTSIELWIGNMDGLHAIGTLQTSTRFVGPVTPINTFYRIPLGTEVLVRGRIEEHRAGKAMTVRDATGQVDIIALQHQRLPVGTEVEAIGRVAQADGTWKVEAALYRPSPPAAAGIAAALPIPQKNLCTTVAQIRALASKEAAQGQTVDISGMVTWLIPESDFLYLQDFTGGIRVYAGPARTRMIRCGEYLRIQGVTQAGPVVPTVELRDFTIIDAMSNPPAQLVTLEQALTGKVEGDWVEMRGFVQDTVFEGDSSWIHLITTAGSFTGCMQNQVHFAANPGSLIRVHGVCETTVSADGRVSGILLRVPYIHDIAIEEDAPADFYDLPRSSLNDLALLSTRQDMQRVKVSGTVEHAIPGQQVYLADEGSGLLLLTRDKQPLRPGDRIEAVGILGREGARTILRETLLRKTGSGPPLDPIAIPEAGQLVFEADSRLVRLRGILIDHVVFGNLGRTRLMLQQGNTLFEAMLEQSAGAPRLNPVVGSGLEVTGIYQLKFDDARQARGFQLQLRTPDDLAVYMKPPLWTAQRLLAVVALLVGCVLLGLTWIHSLHRQVQQQTNQLRSQMEHQARLEAEVQRAARLESLGVLAGGISHGYNNLLTVILGHLSLMKSAPPGASRDDGQLAEIEQAAWRARDLTRQLLTFADGGEPLREPVDLFGLVREKTELVLRDGRIRFTPEVTTDLLPVYGDRDQLAQVIQNLVRNALEAMPGGGSLRLLLANVEIEAGFHPNLKAGRYVRLILIDTGEGIAPAVLPQIFDPYFSTKKMGGGLGLATVYSVLKKHGGHIEAQSQPGNGATFTLWLPVAEEAVAKASIKIPLAASFAPIPSEPKINQPPASAQIRVMLMDDEPSIRKLGTVLLERMGLEVLAVADGASALGEFVAARDSHRPFALLIFDLTIEGGMGGKDTIEAIRKIDAVVPAIVSSGYSRDPVMAHFRAYGFQDVIPKPYDISLFKETIRRVLPKGT